MRRILWRDSIMSWPGLSVKVELAPWHWRLFRWYFDEVRWYCSVEFGPFEVKFCMNQPAFALEYGEPLLAHPEPELSDPVTWQELVEACSYDGGSSARVVRVVVDAVTLAGGDNGYMRLMIVPTSVHEPGFFVSPTDPVSGPSMILRSASDMEMFRQWVDEGLVHPDRLLRIATNGKGRPSE